MKTYLFKKYKEVFKNDATDLFISPGRLEIVGNHTDHNHGFALVAGASLNMQAAARKSNSAFISLFSEGHGTVSVNSVKVDPANCKKGTSEALVQGIVSSFIDNGYNVGGFNAYIKTNVLTGSGISSSAAYELLICEILNYFYNDDSIPKIELCKIAQISENKFFGKPCGILDQIGCGFGNINFVDFVDPKNPKVETINFPFNDIRVVLTNPGGDHKKLTGNYSSICEDMFNVAKLFNKKFLRDIDSNEIIKNKEVIASKLNELSFNRALHFIEENKRVKQAKEAIKNNDLNSFIDAVNGSGLSSSNVLCNTHIDGMFEGTPEEALQLARTVAPKSAHRVHGGGFMGTIISFVRPEEYNAFKEAIVKKYGEKAFIDVSIDEGVHHAV